jgi:hypothetical protein
MRDPHEDNRRPEEIESDIERTRAEMSSTIEAIQSKLTPGQLMDQAFDYARTSLPAEFSTNLRDTVRDNPMPVMLIGVGIAWLMASGRQGTGHAGEGRMHRAASKVSETGHSLAGKASDIGHRVSDRTSEIAGRARDMGRGTRERIGEISQRSQQGYYRTRDSLSHMADEQPLLLGALGLAVGTLLGAVLPNTRREDEFMGEKRDDLVQRAKGTMREQMDAVKESAHRVAEDQKSGEPAQSATSHASASASTGAESTDTTRFGSSQSPYGPH